MRASGKRCSPRFGPAGIPVGCKGGTLAGVKYVREEGLNAFEVEFVRGVKLSEEKAREVGRVASQLDVELSAHAPYWINCCSKERKKIEISIRNLVQSLKVSNAMQAKCVVFHPGYYMGMSSGEAFKLCVRTLEEVLERIGKVKTKLSPETTGKPTQFGSLEEVIALCREMDMMPTIDFAHLHARNNGMIKGKEDYLKIFDKIERELGRRVVKTLHIHFSEIEFNEKGEKRHLNLFTTNSPPVKEMLKVIKEQGYSPTIICETPLLDKDALKMKEMFEKI